MGRATLNTLLIKYVCYDISIHALRGEGDNGDVGAVIYDGISIHALRGEGDVRTDISSKTVRANFNPRPPWGGRQYIFEEYAAGKAFQSTPSVGRATLFFHYRVNQNILISIHALRGEGDSYKIISRWF